MEKSLDSTKERLLNLARAAQQNAYARYSNFKVGAAVLLENGETFTGCNVENASYGLTNCAERSAIFAAVSKLGGANVKIRAVAVVKDRKSTRLNSSHANISYAVFCLKKKPG